MNGEDLVPARMNVEQFQGHVLAELRTIGREVHDLKEKAERQGEHLAAWPATCAGFRLKLVITVVTISVAVSGGVAGIVFALLR